MTVQENEKRELSKIPMHLDCRTDRVCVYEIVLELKLPRW